MTNDDSIYKSSEFLSFSAFVIYFVSSVFGFNGSRFNSKRNSFVFPSVLSGRKILSCTFVKARPRVSVSRCWMNNDGFS